jgi:hypothetical protein
MLRTEFIQLIFYFLNIALHVIIWISISSIHLTKYKLKENGPKKKRYGMLETFLFLLWKIIQKLSYTTSPSKSQTFQLSKVPQKILKYRLNVTTCTKSTQLVHRKSTICHTRKRQCGFKNFWNARRAQNWNWKLDIS